MCICVYALYCFHTFIHYSLFFYHNSHSPSLSLSLDHAPVANEHTCLPAHLHELRETSPRIRPLPPHNLTSIHTHQCQQACAAIRKNPLQRRKPFTFVACIERSPLAHLCQTWRTCCHSDQFPGVESEANVDIRAQPVSITTSE